MPPFERFRPGGHMLFSFLESGGLELWPHPWTLSIVPARIVRMVILILDSPWPYGFGKLPAIAWPGAPNRAIICMFKGRSDLRGERCQRTGENDCLNPLH